MIKFKKSQERLFVTKNNGNLVFNLLIDFCRFLFLIFYILIFSALFFSFIIDIKGDILDCKRISAELIECQIHGSILNETDYYGTYILKQATVVKKVVTNENDTNREVFQVLLLTIDNETLNFSNLKDSKSEAEQISQKINNFISDSSQASLKIKRPLDTISVIIIYLVFFLSLASLTGSWILGIKHLCFNSYKAIWDFDIEKRLLIITKIYFCRFKRQKHSLLSLNRQEIFSKSELGVFNIKLIQENSDDILLELESDLIKVKQLSELIYELIYVKLQAISIYTPQNINWLFDLNQRTLVVNSMEYAFHHIDLLIEPIVNTYTDDSGVFYKYVYCYSLYIVVSSSEKLSVYASYKKKDVENYRLLVSNFLKLA